MTQHQLPGLFRDLQPVLEHYGYLAVGGFVLFEDFGVPVPGETMLLAAAIFAGAFVQGLRQLNGFIAVTVGMRWLKFLAFNALGALLWVCTWALLGYFAGQNITQVYAAFDRYKWLVIAATIVVIIAVVAYRVRRQRTPETA